MKGGQTSLWYIDIFVQTPRHSPHKNKNTGIWDVLIVVAPVFPGVARIMARAVLNGCDKLSVFDWLANMDQPSDKDFDIVEVRFKNGRKEFFRNTQRLSLHINEALAVEGSPGHDIGTVSMIGQLVKAAAQAKKPGSGKREFP